MKLGILTFSTPKQDSSTAVTRLSEAAKKRGHEVVLLYEPYLTIGHDQALEILYQGNPLPALDAVIVRANFVEEPSLHTVTLEALSRAGIRLMNGVPLVSISKNKLAQRLVLEKAGVAMPRWSIARTQKYALLEAQKIGFPLVIKVAFGTHGKGVFYAEDEKTLRPILDYLLIRDKNPVIIEEFVKEARGVDIRAFVVGDTVVAAMELAAPDSDIRSNVVESVGAVAKLSVDEIDAAVRATKAMGLDMAGVDMMRSARGPLVLEVNANPGFEELEKVTGVDVADAIIASL